MDSVDPEADDNSNAAGAACYRCRGFRHACDRKKPTCSRCQRRGITCTYPEAAPTLKKLQKATETLGERLKKFGDRIKNIETVGRDLRCIPLQRTDSMSSADFSIYPCSKCFKDLQACDLSMPNCARCVKNGWACEYSRTEPKANHVSQVLTTMNKVVDSWQEALDKVGKDVAQTARDFGASVNSMVKKLPPPKPLPPLPPFKPSFAWKITSTGRGLSMESNVSSYNDLSKLVDQFKRTLHISTPQRDASGSARTGVTEPASADPEHRAVALDIWNTWFLHGGDKGGAHIHHSIAPDHHLDISQQLTDNLILLFLRTPCCSSIRVPVIDTRAFHKQYHDAQNPPSKLLVYSICAMTSRNAFQIHVWAPRQDSSNHNMGKALSLAYCKKGRDLFADCFDDPSIENMQAALFLSYSHQQNGKGSAIHIYEWIMYAMAQCMGLYDRPDRLTSEERLLLWSMYYFHAWTNILTGSAANGKEFFPAIPLPLPPPAETIDPDEFQVRTVWFHIIKLQIQRHNLLTHLTAASYTTSEAIGSLHADLDDWHRTLPPAWQDCVPAEHAQRRKSDGGHESFCILFTHVNFHINKILVNIPFFTTDRMPDTAFTLQALITCFESARFITEAIELMVTKRGDCNIPLLGYYFSNSVFAKLFNIPLPAYLYEPHQNGAVTPPPSPREPLYPFRKFVRHHLLRSVATAKQSNSFMYDFELAQNYVSILERNLVELGLIDPDAKMEGETPASMQMGEGEMDVDTAVWNILKEAKTSLKL
ncbi:hypothetical protein BC936DRAFT_138941 [Jimgerdemannia flammicorona]|uniref:Zn(2)-C6 fungal-type domain-containing protein n=1 Tax=Jimgerdemannia flammicorona TaxID=994334 RepID=A0A433BD54_9FUNG|nr:hypothetical protein BC936DRAFT_138941 [Jimgerdemannia flammicorona]